MFVKLNDVWLTSDRPETYTQAYHAGVIYAMLENELPDEKIPSLIECIVNFHALRELFGERLWQKLKSRGKFKSRISVYEKLTFQPLLPRTIIGGSREFVLGYAFIYKRTKLKKNADKRVIEDIPDIIQYLSR